MLGILSEAVAFPTVIFTVLLALALLYWAVALLGLVDLGALEGAAQAIEGAADALEGAADTAEGVTGAAEIGGGRSAVAEGPRLLGLGEVPMTISMTLLSAFGWLASFFGMRLGLGLSDVWKVAVPAVVVGIAVLGVALVAALALTGLAIRPLRPLFRIQRAPRRASFVGQTCTVHSARVDESFGYADLEGGGAGLRIDVRCPSPNPLKSGSRATLERWDADREVYWVKPARGPASAEAAASGSEPR